MDYQNGKIYTIRSPHTEKYYIGACITPLAKRFWTHKKIRNCMSREIIDAGNAYIELLELFPCNSKMELSKREGELQRQHRADIVNFRIEGKTDEEKKQEQSEHRKMRYEKDKDEILLAQREYSQRPESKEIHNAFKRRYTTTPEYREKRNANLKEKRRLKKEAEQH